MLWITFVLCKWTSKKASLPQYKIGLQLFSVRDAMADDPKGTLIALKAMGYEDFETYGFDPTTKPFMAIQWKSLKLF